MRLSEISTRNVWGFSRAGHWTHMAELLLGGMLRWIADEGASSDILDVLLVVV
jgi:hypothetical protein